MTMMGYNADMVATRPSSVSQSSDGVITATPTTVYDAKVDFQLMDLARRKKMGFTEEDGNALVFSPRVKDIMALKVGDDVTITDENATTWAGDVVQVSPLDGKAYVNVSIQP